MKPERNKDKRDTKKDKDKKKKPQFKSVDS
jgi:hypothetical protein